MKSRIFLLLIAFALGLCLVGPTWADDGKEKDAAKPNAAKQDEAKQDEAKQDEAKQDEAKKDDKKDADEASDPNAGAEDLEKATEAKIAATTITDLGTVIDLCESALKKGLDEQNTTFAKHLLASSLAERGKTIASRVIAGPSPSPQWPSLRDASVKDLERSVKIIPDQPEIWLILGQLYLLPPQNVEKSLAAVDKSIAGEEEVDAETRVRAHVLRATIVKEPAKRLESLDKAIELAPSSAAAIRARALVYADLKEWEKALEDFKTAMLLEPDHVATLEAEALVLGRLKRYDEAMKCLDRVEELQPDSISPYRLRAQLLSMQSKYDEAAAELEKALKKKPGDPVVLLLLANIHEQAGNMDAALADIDRLIEKNPKLPMARRMRILLLIQNKKYDQASAELEKLIKKDPEDIDLQAQLAMLYSAMHQPAKAVEVYDKVLQKEPDNFDALRGKADAFLALGKHAEAISIYDKALKIDPENSGVLNNLAWVLATSPKDDLRDGKRAVKLATKACEETDYKAGHILSTLAAAYAETGDFETARKWSAKAVEEGREEELEALKKELRALQEGNPLARVDGAGRGEFDRAEGGLRRGVWGLGTVVKRGIRVKKAARS